MSPPWRVGCYLCLLALFRLAWSVFYVVLARYLAHTLWRRAPPRVALGRLWRAFGACFLGSAVLRSIAVLASLRWLAPTAPQLAVIAVDLAHGALGAWPPFRARAQARADRALWRHDHE